MLEPLARIELAFSSLEDYHPSSVGAYMVDEARIELAALGTSNRRSTTELPILIITGTLREIRTHNRSIRNRMLLQFSLQGLG